ncbi:hypothetical protein I3842_06G133600 [Carya illinoinensis]|uniref:Uncharacterized protein n=1 Tax=Carya illinoinensis TaxID=32201 RepID=A0A922JM47_CARIL|nr:hypothetical protein I3842_06G133600 [Carya illinoinensis]
METCFGKRVMLLWFVALTTFCPSAWGEGCNKEQKRALLEIRNSTDGLAFKDFDGTGDCCELDEIMCNGPAGLPNQIYIGGTPSRTWIPNVTLFTLFGELEELDLGGSNIGGELQAFCELKRLKSLRFLSLRNNTLEGNIPSCLGTFESLEELDLSGNRLHGNLPSSIFSNQSRISWFDVSDNQLDGNIPSFLGTIQDLDISNNRFHGNLPSSIFSNQSQISSFDVSGNQLEGPVLFSIFANASSLYYLDLSNNYELEVDTESPTWIPTFQLTTLKLANCNLNKKDSHVVPSFISTQINLRFLDMSYNSLEGGIPCQLFLNTNNTELYLRSNKIEGSFLDCFINGTSNLGKFDISDNRVKGPIPENFASIFSSLYGVAMSSNELEGKIPSSFGSMSLNILDLSNNMLSGTIPRSLTGNDTTLVYLNLSNNTLQGEMLPRDSNLTRLECLYLGGNHFEGKISPAISNSRLVLLDVCDNYLSGNIPKWLYDHPHLVAVLLSGNHLEGHLTQRLCRMQRLQVFDVSRNRLSGGIPSCLDNVTFWKKSSPSTTNSNYFMRGGGLYFQLKSNYLFFLFRGLDFESVFRIKGKEYTFKGVPLLLMTVIDLSSNQLTGGIPFEMGELSQLRSLNLSHNSLTGSIPISFQNLTNVESLDLSHNKLRGKIPSELVGLTSLSTLSVAYNNLSGRIPFKKQFSTFGTQCYDNNPELCGGPLPRKCSSTNPLKDDKDEKERSRIIDHPLFFYGFVIVSYAFGFWAFFGILIIKKNWRQNYFRAVDRYIELFLEFLFKYR